DAVLGNADLEEALTQSVDAHYVADVPVSILLSGGTDSSLIAALSKKLGRRPTAYHVAVAGSRDTEYATAIAKRLDLPLVVATLDDVALTRQYEKLADILDEPTADVSLIPTSLVFERIKGEAKVVLSGEGGDELFGGYLRHALLARHRKVAKQSFATSALGSLYGTSPAALAYMNPLLGRVTEALLRAGMPDDLAGAYLRSARLADYPLYDREARARLVALYRSDAGAGVPPALAFDLLAYLPNDLLPKSDIASMASSIEARVPFVDRWLLAAALRAHAEGRPPVGDKALLKEVLARYLPADLVYREKGGFGIPLHAYDLPAFAADFDAACRFHLANREAFAVNDQLAALIGEPSLRALIRRKFPRFAFALVTNWRVCE
ncbi:MAG: asparagine synthase, partial [Patescibacteria group bacterium]|nr:asparagine synthase [Patescibacteria group bacterium]